MDSAPLRKLVTHLRESPAARFASVYYDSSFDTEDAAKHLELTWRELRKELERQGAPNDTLATLTDAVREGAHPVGKAGRALIVSGREVLVDTDLTEPPARAVARWSQLPYLVPLVAHAVPTAAHVVARVDSVGADVVGVDSQGHVVDQHTVTGAEYPVHKVEKQGRPYRTHDREHVEETVKQNISKVADDVGTLVRKIGATLVVVAGEVRGRAALLKELPEDSRSIAVDVESGGRQRGSDNAVLDDRVRELVRKQERRRTDSVVERFVAESGRGAEGLAVQGVERTCAALREANVATLLIADDGYDTVFAGPDPIELAVDAEQLLDLGLAKLEQRQADEALPLAAIAVGADLVHVGDKTELADGYGAILRHT